MRPIYDMLQNAAARTSGHMPGHKGKAPFGPVDLYRLDTTEIPLTDDLYAPEHGIRAAQELYAQSAGAAETIFLHNGSTQGIHVMLQLWAHEGDTIILPRNAHHSAIDAAVLGGLVPVWIPVTQLEDGYFFVREEDVISSLSAHPEAKVILLTRPDYYGGCIPLNRIAEKAHSLGIRLVVDEAHGAHFPWLDEMDSAGAFGADAWVQSVHKTLPGLTGSAVLHLKDSHDLHQAIRIFRREQTSSPSFVLMMSIDDARAWMQQQGKNRLHEVIQAADQVRKRLPELGYTDAFHHWSHLGLSFDPSRLVIDAPQGGAALAASLQQLGYDVEMHDNHRVVCILSAMNTPEDILHIAKLLAQVPAEKKEIIDAARMYDAPPQVLTPRAAVMSVCRSIPLEDAAGRIAAQSAGLYPPGIPLVMPGELITAETVDLLLAAGNQQRFGVEGDSLLCVDA